jgi:hypothetical protein
LIRKLLKNNLENIHGDLQYKKKGSAMYADAPLIHFLLSWKKRDVEYHELLKLLVEFEPYRLNTPDINGNTALLYAVYYLPFTELVINANYLINHGADVCAENAYGENALHLLFRGLSACNYTGMDQTQTDAMVSLAADLITKGCDPGKQNLKGFTPFDAARAPVAWKIFHDAIAQAGKDIVEIMARVSASSGLGDAKKTGSASGGRRDETPLITPIRNTRPFPHAVSDTCYRCGCTKEQQQQGSSIDVPFDEFSSAIVDELGVSLHLTLSNHVPGETCLQIHREDSSKMLDYYPVEFSLERLIGRDRRMWKLLELMWT